MVKKQLSLMTLLGMLAAVGPHGRAVGSSGGFSVLGFNTIESITLSPYLATDLDDVTVRVCGQVVGLYYGAEATSSVSGSTIDVDVLVGTNPQYPYVTSWCADAPVGLLAAGQYTVSVHVSVNEGPTESRQAQATVTPAHFCWGDRATITSNDVSDSYPAPVVFNDRLYVFWNKTYDGSVVAASYDGTSWTNDATIADCATRSAIGAAVLGGRIHVFYSRSIGYPTSHLFYTSSADGVNWSSEQEITTGPVLDDYGATATVHDGHVYVLWKRWKNDGFRYVYSMTYDGFSFGPPAQLWPDGYIDSPVGAASFQGKLYTFYGGGVLYRVFDGVSWSSEHRASNLTPYSGNVTASPATSVANGRLTLMLVSYLNLLYEADFDGTTWTESRVAAESEAESSIVNLGATVFHDDLHLFWGGAYWQTTAQLRARVFTDADEDTVADRCDVCPDVPDPDQTDLDADGHGAVCDCDDTDDATYPGAPETNDGLDNQCLGDAGYGTVDEISDVTGFLDPTDKSAYCWLAQAGATAYEAKRADCSTMCSSCESYATAGLCWHDAANPLPASTFFYLVHATAPYAGSWGRDSSGVERTVCP